MAWNAEQYMTSYLGLPSPLKSLGTDVPTLVALLVCLIPTTIGALLAAIGIAGMDRALQANIIAKSGKAVEVAGDVDVVMLDKTGTITMGNRRATRSFPSGFHRRQCGGSRGTGLRGRRDPGRQEHRQRRGRKNSDAGQRSQGRGVCKVHRADAHERRRSARRAPSAQGRARRHREFCGRARRRQFRRTLARSSTAWLPRARRRLWWPMVREQVGRRGVGRRAEAGIKERFERLRKWDCGR
jgi:hypothetical protein